MRLTAQLFRKIGIDLGSNKIRIWSDYDGVLIDEPTCLAVDERSQKVLAAGQDALDMSGRVASHIKIFHPVVHGKIEDPEITQALLKVLLQKIMRTRYFFKPIIMISMPASSDEIALQAITDVLYNVGAHEVYTIAQPLASAIGAGVPIADTSGSFVLHMGGGVVEGGIISLGSLIVSESSEFAGDYIDQQIAQQIKKELTLNISLETAQKIKHLIATLGDVEEIMLVSGQDISSSVPKEITVSSKLIQPVVKSAAERYTDLIRSLLEKIPPELTSDLIDKGMLLTGGLASLDGLDSFLVKKLGVPVSVVDDADKVVIQGIGTALEHLDLFKESLGYQV